MLNATTFTNNFILSIDAYKADQLLQLAPGVSNMHANMVPRKTFEGIDEIVVMGNSLVARYLESVIIDQDMVDEAEFELNAQGYEFPRDSWATLIGKAMPIIFRGVPDGTVLPVGVAINSIEAEDGYGWLAGYIETWAQRIVWYMSTVASKCRVKRAMLKAFCEDTGTSPDAVEYMLHNFGDRGAQGSEESAVQAGIAHAVFFSGSDCVPANKAIRAIYGDKGSYTSSVTASEHRTMCSNSILEERNDYGAFEMSMGMLERAVERANRGIGIPVISAVVDTYDDERFIREFVAGNINRIANSGGKYVCRVDSGNAVRKPYEAVEWLMGSLGDVVTVNDKGFRELPPYIGVLQGDGLRDKDILAICELFKQYGLSASNIVFGQGGGLVSDNQRGDFSFSMKATAQFRNGIWEDLAKDPKSDKGKRSLVGRITTYRDTNGQYFSDRLDLVNVNSNIEDAFIDLYRNGKAVVDTFDNVRKRARIGL